MKRYSIFHPLILSFFSKALYRDVGQRWRGTGLAYLLLVLAIVWIPTMIKMQFGLAQFVDHDSAKITEQIPAITISHGKVSTNVTTPYYIKDPETGADLIIIDDPLLRPTYGFLNFERLLRLVEEFNLFVTIAFIPYNYRRNSRRIVRMFRENRERLAICFHGNDHTTEELASSDISRLNTMLDIAESRMSIHHKSSGVDCHRVMVFPQGNFSVEAMQVLNSRNFDGAVNTTPNPMHEAVRLTLGEWLEILPGG